MKKILGVKGDRTFQLIDLGNPFYEGRHVCPSTCICHKYSVEEIINGERAWLYKLCGIVKYDDLPVPVDIRNQIIEIVKNNKV